MQMCEFADVQIGDVFNKPQFADYSALNERKIKTLDYITCYFELSDIENTCKICIFAAFN